VRVLAHRAGCIDQHIELRIPNPESRIPA
jgi:hypothetical protein